MNIILDNIGKNFYQHNIFSKINFNLKEDDYLAVLGTNGSGKSTLLKIISGYLSHSEGKITYKCNNKIIKETEIYKYISIAAPYSGLIDEYTVEEMLCFHFKFKKIIKNYSLAHVIKNAFLDKYLNTSIKNCSSGTKQRLKLALALYSDTPLLLLDEPLSNLDTKGIEWYSLSIEDLKLKRIIIVCSNNNKKETFFCNKFIELNEC